MKKLSPSVKSVVASTLVLTSTAVIAYAVPGMNNEKKATDIGEKLKLEVERVDGDTVKVALDNVKDIPKSLQFSIKLDGVVLQDGEKSIHDLIAEEVQNRLNNNVYPTDSNSVLTDYTYNESENTIDVLITSENSLPKVGNKIEIVELDVKESSNNNSGTYKVLPNSEADYKYVSSTNKEYGNLGVVHDNEEISLTAAPTIESVERYLTIIEGEEVTAETLTDKLSLKLNHEDGTNDLELEIIRDGKAIETFSENTPGVYDLELKAVKDKNLKSEALAIQVNVILDQVTEPPTITINGKELDDLTLDGGSVFNPLENVKAVDKKGRTVKVDVKADKDLDLDPDQDTEYELIYTATDIYGNTATKKVLLTVKANQAPIISGIKDHTISVGDQFKPEDGVSVKDDKDQDIELKVESNVNTKIPGKYKVSYSATDSGGKTTRAQSTVTVNPKPGVINKAPVITASDKTIDLGTEFDPLEGVTAFDEEEKDLTKAIKVVENNVDSTTVGTYKVVYQVTDNHGAKATKEITVTVIPKVVLATDITIADKDDNKVYVGGSKAIKASINKEADLQDIDWGTSDASIAELKVDGNEAMIIAQDEGKVTLTASTKDGSNLSDTIKIHVSNFKDDNEIPSHVRDLIDIKVLKPMSGIGVKEYPVVFNVRDVAADQLDSFFDGLESLDYELVSIQEYDEFINYHIKITKKFGIFGLFNWFKSTEEIFIDIKVSKDLKNADEINDRFGKLADNKTEQPETDQPETDNESDKPESDNGTDQPETDNEGNKPETDNGTGKPETDIEGDKPEMDNGTDQPETDNEVDKPETDNGTEHPETDNEGDKPETDNVTGKPQTDNETDKPNTNNGSDKPQSNKPTISIDGLNNNLTVGDKFDPLNGVTAHDKDNSDITDSINVSGTVDTSKPGKYPLTYSQGGKVSITTEITVSEKEETPEENKGEKPVIKVQSSIDTLTVGDEFNPLDGVSAYDKEDGDLTGSITVSGTVDTSKPGKYTLIYTVSDKDGNTYSFTRIITVTEKTNESPESEDSNLGIYIGIAAAAITAVGGVVLNKRRKDQA